MRSSILLGKATAQISKLRNRAGSTWPGHIALKADARFVRNILAKNPHLNLILIAGTNGKTTTAKLLQDSLELKNKKVFRNAAGANLLNGIASTLLKNSNLSGKLPYEYAILEIDENSLPLILDELSPVNSDQIGVKRHVPTPTQSVSIILLNLFRDQLDRYGEVNTIAKNWLNSLKLFSNQGVTLITNGDDPMLRFIGENSGMHSFYFGLDEKYMKKMDAPHDVDFLYCPHCGVKLSYSKRSYSHMGIYACLHCGFKHRETAVFKDIANPLLGVYNKYNINAAALLLQKAYGIDPSIINKALESFSPAFGRQEEIKYKGKKIFLLLSKNPTGFNQSIEAVLEQDKNPNILLLLNDRVPDGRDISWIWDVDLEHLVSQTSLISVGGDRAYDMALRIKYSSEFKVSNFKFPLEEDLKKAIESSLGQTKKDETLYILATYSAMLETRKILKGRSIL